MKKTSLFLLLSALSLLSSSQNHFISDSLDVYILREMKAWDVPGLSLALVKDGKVVVSKGYGVRDVAKPAEKVDENTLFQIASNTKAFTATSLALLAYQHRISLDDKVTRWMKDFQLKDPLATADVRIRDLLCHRLGFETFQSDMLNWGGNLTRKEIITNLRNVEPVYPFRAHYGYCNAAFLTAGEIIPLATDTTWDDFLKYHFFQPLKMTRTSTTWNTIHSDPNACVAYTAKNEHLVAMPFVNVDNLGPAASINSCVKDLSHWLLMQLDSGRFEGKRLLPFSVLQNTRSSQMVVRDQNNPYFASRHFETYGLGWFLEDYNGKKIVSHDGGANGFVTTTCLVPELNLGIVVLTNTDVNNLFGAIRMQILDAYMGLPYRNYSQYYLKFHKASQLKDAAERRDQEEAVASKNKADLALKEYAGTFHNAVYGDITIKEENGKLAIHFSHHPTLIGHLELLEKSSFLCTYSDPEYGVKVIPFTITEGKANSVSVSVNDFIDYMSYEFKRVQ
jgi:CubicO group peptidase (beta-lactamase class C family)